MEDNVVPRDREKKLLADMFNTVRYDIEFWSNEIPEIEQDEDDD